MKTGWHHTVESYNNLCQAIRTPAAKEKARQSHLGKHHTPGSKEKNRQARLGKRHTSEAIEKICQSKLGKHSTPEAIERNRQSNLGRHHTPETKEKIRQKARTPESRERSRQANLGRRVSLETREKLRRSRLRLTPEAREKMRQANMGKHPSSETIEKIRRSHTNPEAIENMRHKMRRLHKDPEYLKKWSNGLHSKTKPEKHLEQLLQCLYPSEFKYNGGYDCGITVDGLTPDFVNVNGRKQVIDVHGSYWHEGEDVAVRQARYAKYGYSSLIIWDYELKDEKAVVQRIVEFVGKPPNLYFETQPVTSVQCTSKRT